MNIGVELATNMYDALIGVLFLNLFCDLRFKKRFFIPSVLIIFGISTVFTFVNDFSLLHSLIITAGLYLYCFILKPANKVKFVLAPIIFEVILMLVNTVCLALFSRLFNMTLVELISCSGIIRYSLIIFSKILITTFLFLVWKFFSVSSRLDIKSLILYLLSPVATVYILYVFMKISLTYDLSEYTAFIISGVICIAVLNIVTIAFFEISNRNNEARIRLELMNNQAELERKNYQKMIEAYDELIRVRHDIKHHLLYVKDIISKNDIDSADKYIDGLEAELRSTEKYMVTGCRTLDYILMSKKASNPDVNMICTGRFEMLGEINDLDIAIVFGNLLDNAIEGVKDVSDKCIEIKLYDFNNYRNIQISNAIDHSVLKSNPELHSTKKRKGEHGFGLKSVRSIVEKYDGIFEIFEGNNKFTVQISMPIKS